MRTKLLALVTVAVAGCATQPQIQVQTVQVPMPVECQEPMPLRPVMPTEELGKDVNVAEWIRAAMAELLRRESYEERLRTSLDNCRKPIDITPIT